MTFQLKEPKLRGRARALFYTEQQRKWIEHCEANGRSYTGPNGPAIRAADEQALRRWESELAHWPAPRAEQQPC